MSSRVVAYGLMLLLAAGHVLVAQAQNQTFITGLLANLNGLGLTNLTNVMTQVQADANQIAFFLSLSDSSTPKTFFAPNNAAFQSPEVNFNGYPYQSDDTNFLGALLLYHLLPGTFLLADLGSGPNHTIVTTSLQGHSESFLENDESQVIACGSSVAGFEIYNQLTTTAVLSTTTFGHVTIHTLNAIIGMPGTYTFGENLLDISSFDSVRSSAGVQPIENSHGITIFAPEDGAFTNAKSQLSSTSPQAVFNNHVINGQTIWYSTFRSKTYTSASGHNYSFALTSDLGYTVTLNGVTANIIRSDFLLNNGVIHVLDAVLSNTTAEPTSAPAPPSASASNGGSKSDLSGGAIAGIVIGVVALLGGLLLAFLFWRRQHGEQHQTGYFDSPHPYPVHSSGVPFTTIPGDGMSEPANTPGVSAPLMYHASSDIESNDQPVHTQPYEMGEKGPPVNHQPDSGTTDFQSLMMTGRRSTDTYSPQSQQGRAGSSAPISDEVVDHLLQRFAQRIDRGPAGDPEAPPMYPA
ncbi:hypothetical protein PHLCEN_2v9158 [Hermanssonia centrifuga]|uniref:FAS1 domain-containing protein n=1 Tax=Hermanssonia centrifuga TaxID=98765 RepID=A0A2R6NRR6_9APHY|nr:hypothetical protein PHLCEN_2v9158 [Hermanssonia centrifuga]